MDHGARVIVFGKNRCSGSATWEDIAQRAYWNSSYVAGTYEDRKKTGF